MTNFFRSGRMHALLLGLSFSLFAVAQRNCGSMDYLDQQIQADPDRAARLQEIESFTQTWIEEHGAEDRAVVTIPVVFHVVYANSAQNITDAKVQAQIAQLNADFARLNSDANQTPAVFAALGANTEVQFCLAQRDPSGAATTGIVRRSTTVSSFSSNDAVKYTANGGSNAWPRDSYLNIWSCNLGSSLLGYAQFPGGAAATDGVVVLYSSRWQSCQPRHGFAVPLWTYPHARGGPLAEPSTHLGRCHMRQRLGERYPHTQYQQRWLPYLSALQHMQWHSHRDDQQLHGLHQ